MTPRYDLHTHTWFSDGTLSPTELVERAAAAGVNVLALTDHDDTSGLAEAARAAAHCGIELVPGVEVSATWEKTTIHIVGLGFNPDAPALSAGLAELRTAREERAREMARRLEKHGVKNPYEGAWGLAHGAIISRTHFARYLSGQGFGNTMGAVFKHFLRRGKPGYVPGRWVSMEEAVGWIRTAGGVAVIAHPARYELSRSKLLRLFREFRDCGGTAAEVVSGSHGPADTETMARYVRESGLAASVGSDYHGPENPWRELGRLPPLPDDLLPVWQHPDWPERRPPADETKL